MNTKIQKLIAYNEKVLAHFDGRHKLNTSDLLDCFVLSSRLLQEISKATLDAKQEKDDREVCIKGLEKLNKLLSKSLFENRNTDANNLLVQYKLANGYRGYKKENKELLLKNKQLKAELELMKEKQINNF